MMVKRLRLTLKEISLQVGGRNERRHEKDLRLVAAIKPGDALLAEKSMILYLQGIEQEFRYRSVLSHRSA